MKRTTHVKSLPTSFGRHLGRSLCQAAPSTAVVGFLILTLCGAAGDPNGGKVPLEESGFAYKVSDGTLTGGRLVVKQTGSAHAVTLPIQGGPIRWVEPWNGFAVAEKSSIYRVGLDGKRSLVYDLGPLVESITESVRRKSPKGDAVSVAYDVDITPHGDRLALLTNADWGIRSINLATKQVRLVTTGAEIAKRIHENLRLSFGSQTGIRWRPDGQKIAVGIPGTEVWGEDGDESETALIVASADGKTAERVGNGVPIDWIDRGRLLALFTPEGGDERELRVYAAGSGLKGSLTVSTPVQASWDGRSVLFLKQRGSGKTASYSVIRATPDLKIEGSEVVRDRPVTLTGIPGSPLDALGDAKRGLLADRSR